MSLCFLLSPLRNVGASVSARALPTCCWFAHSALMAELFFCLVRCSHVQWLAGTPPCVSGFLHPSPGEPLQERHVLWDGVAPQACDVGVKYSIRRRRRRMTSGSVFKLSRMRCKDAHTCARKLVDYRPPGSYQRTICCRIALGCFPRAQTRGEADT